MRAALSAALLFQHRDADALGYGDVAPPSERAQALAGGEAIVGQLYIAIFITRLVGLHLWHQRTGGD